MNEKAKKSWYKKWWGILLIIFGVIVVLSSIAGQGNDDKTASNTETNTAKQAAQKTNKEPAKPQKKTFKVGDEVQVGEVKWIVTKPPEKLKELSGQYAKETANGIFVLLELKAELTGKESGTVDSSQFRLIDSQDRKFKTSEKGISGLINVDKESIFLKQVDPNVPVTGYAVFDIPVDATGLKLQIEDLRFTSDLKEVIDLGM